MTTKKGRPRVVTALMAVALVAAACSKSPPTTGAGAGSAPSTGAGGTVARAVEFSQCMRAHGVSGFPDPDSSGQLTIDGVVNGTDLDLNAPSFQQALGACKGLEPPGFMGTTRTAQQQQAALGFAQCMRANGVPD